METQKHQSLLILGAGQYGVVTKETAEAMKCFDIIGFLDDRGDIAEGKLDEYELFTRKYTHAIVAMGNPQLRLMWLQKLQEAGYELPVLIHPMAYVSPSAKLMPGTIVEPMAAVQAGATVGMGCILCAGCVVNHNSTVGEGCQIDCNAVVPSNAEVPGGIKVACGMAFTAE